MPALVIGGDHRIIMANAAMREIFNADLVGQSAVALFRQAPVLAAMDLAVRDERAGEARFVLADLTDEVTYQFRAAPLNGGALLSLEDHSGLEASARIRRDFVANISHELRTPLTGLTGFIETLRTTARNDADARDRFLEIMDGEARRMGRLVEDLMSLSRVEQDARVRPRAQVDLAAILRSVIATLEGKLADASVDLVVTGLDGAQMVKGDRDQLTQVFLNLCENAIKYGGRTQGDVMGDAAGHVAITLGQIDRDQTLRCAAVRVDIADQGPGIDPVHLPRLTERFYRVDDHRSREMGGTGLGLAIVKHIVGRHRGRIKITSDPGAGACFSVILPR